MGKNYLDKHVLITALLAFLNLICKTEAVTIGFDTTEGILIIVGIIVGAIAILVIFFCCCCRSSSSNKDNKSQQHQVSQPQQPQRQSTPNVSNLSSNNNHGPPTQFVHSQQRQHSPSPPPSSGYSINQSSQLSQQQQQHPGSRPQSLAYSQGPQYNQHQQSPIATPVQQQQYHNNVLPSPAHRESLQQQQHQQQPPALYVNVSEQPTAVVHRNNSNAALHSHHQQQHSPPQVVVPTPQRTPSRDHSQSPQPGPTIPHVQAAHHDSFQQNKRLSSYINNNVNKNEQISIERGQSERSSARLPKSIYKNPFGFPENDDPDHFLDNLLIQELKSKLPPKKPHMNKAPETPVEDYYMEDDYNENSSPYDHNNSDGLQVSYAAPQQPQYSPLPRIKNLDHNIDGGRLH